jgi:hypothetical protein
MNRRWGSKSSKALESNAVLRFSGRMTKTPGGVRPSGGSAVDRLFFFKGSTWFSFRITKCFAGAGFRSTGFGASNDRLTPKAAHDCASPFFIEKVDLKAAPFLDGSELESRQCLDPLSS